jgi:hypothetical protein
MISRVAHALDPMDLPVAKPKDSVNKRSGIQSVPAGSLAQAFLEVFADIGKQRLADDLMRLANAHHDNTPSTAAVQPLALEIAPTDEAVRRQIEAALVAFFDGVPATDDTPATEALSAASAQQLLERLRHVQGAVAQPSLVTAATAYADAIRQHTPMEGPARDMAGSLARMFPDRFTRQRIDIAVDSLDKAPLGPTARRLWDAAAGDIDKFRTSLEGYFDGEMKRLSGHYRRSLRFVMIGLAVVVAVACNVDAVGLARDLWRNPEGRAALVAEADTLTTPTTSAGGTGAGGSSNPDLLKIQDQCRQAAPAEDSIINNPDDAAKAFNDVRRCVTDALNATSGLNVVDNAVWISPSGWWRQWFTGKENWWLHLAGVTATALALIVGAPFWFDILKRLTGIRRATQA